MNVVGKFGSLIYSVATPFHPFSGAIDIIVVKQEDGSFRSTPWYVQFGKFQGVLKGAEKMVRINVNGVEADFHMYLDNSGEAYFVREGELSHDGGDKKGGLKDVSEGVLGHSLSLDNDQVNVDLDNVEKFSRLQSVLSDPGISRDDYRPSRLERNESDASRFYDFQDDQSSDSPVSEYGSGRYDNNDVENFVEAQGLDSEMVLVSVDGHILKAPILSSELNTEGIQLDTPQFHLGPGEGNRFCEVDNSFTVHGNAQDSEYPNNLDAPSSQSLCIDTLSGVNNSHLHMSVSETCKVEDSVIPDKVKEICQDNGTYVVHASEACENGVRFGKTADGGEEIVDLRELNNEGCKEECPMVDHKSPEAYSIEVVPKDMPVSSDVENISPVFKGEDRFKSCLDFTNQANGEMSESEDSPTKAHGEVKDLEEKPSLDVQESNINDTEHALEKPQLDDDSCSSTPDFQSQVVERVHTDIEASGRASVSKDEDFNMYTSVKAANSSLDGDVSATETYVGEVLEGQTLNSSEQREANLRPTIEISLCGHLLHPGMGSGIAAETFKAHCVSEEDFRSSAMSVIKNENLVVRYRDKYLPWEKAAPIVLGLASFGLEMPVDSKDAIPVEQEVVTPKLGKSDIGSASGRRWRLWPNPFRRVKTLQHTNSSVSSDEAFLDSDSIAQSPSSLLQSPKSAGSGSRSEISKPPLKKIIRTNIATNEQIASLNLKEGQNDVTFSFSTRVLGLQQVEAHIYLWKWNTRIVISDVDGTITKSDVLGQFMPLVGKDWSQSGVARLFSAIQENGYQLLFLSARAIVQAYLTKSFLFNLKQDGKTLPTGPVVISPDGLFPSLFREVIRRAPHEFKIACLEDIKALFPSDYNPFYAGFGNRDTDEYTYKKLGIPKGKIFIINPKGEVAINHRIDVKSYTSLHTLVHDMFPQTSMLEQEDYNSWNYWKIQIPEIDV